MLAQKTTTLATAHHPAEGEMSNEPKCLSRACTKDRHYGECPSPGQRRDERRVEGEMMGRDAGSGRGYPPARSFLWKAVEHIWKADIYIQKNSRWFAKRRLKKIGARPHANGCWTVEAEDRTYITRVCDRYRLNCRWYKKEWSRSANYREIFFRNYAPPYRCRYCHRRLKPHKVEVDHLVPVAKAKASRLVRLGLRLQGIRNVNDVRNLVPSCHRCNHKKRDHTGLWYLRGVLGGFRVYWIIRGLLRFAFFAGLAYLIWYLRQKTTFP